MIDKALTKSECLANQLRITYLNEASRSGFPAGEVQLLSGPVYMVEHYFQQRGGRCLVTSRVHVG